MIDLSDDEMFLSLPEYVRAEFQSSLKSKSYPAGHIIFQQGDKARGYYHLVSGQIDVSTLTHEGVEKRIARLSAPYWFGEMSFLDNAPRTHNATIAMPAEIAFLPAKKVATLIEKYPEFHQALVLKLCRHTRLLYRAVNDFLILTPERLLAKRLIKNLVSLDGCLQVALTQDDLARLIGVSRQSVNRILRVWEEKEYVSRDYGSVKIYDVDALQSLSG